MSEARPIMRADALRRAVSDWAAQGFTVRVEPDGAIVVTPPQRNAGDDFDLVDMRR